MTAPTALHPPAQRAVSWRLARDHGLFALFPLLATLWLIVHIYADRIDAVDFRHEFWVAGVQVLHGASPYTVWTHAQIAGGVGFPYPALTALLAAPLALLPQGAGALLLTGLCLASVIATLRTVGVGDWRLYGLVLILSPVVTGWQTTNVTLPLTLGVALAWRHRDRPRTVGLLVGLVVAIKPIFFPLGIWLLATRRFRAAGGAVGAAVVLSAVAWVVVGVDELPRWLDLVALQGDLFRHGYSIVETAAGLGVTRAPATVVLIVLAISIAFLILREGHRCRDLGAFALAALLTIEASPQVDGHYFAVMLVPLAIAVPTVRAIWLLLLALWACPVTQAGTWQQVLWWLVLLATVIVTVSPVSPRPPQRVT